MVSSNAQALTAPGSRPVDPLPDRADQGDPSIEATAYEGPVRLGPSGAPTVPDKADRRVLLNRGGGWAGRNEL